ncbi:MAG: hypothetical protein M3540_06955 [Actinomycetota bacterium]|nr:hypothetical protein [Actinomycetota bacterium]
MPAAHAFRVRGSGRLKLVADAVGNDSHVVRGERRDQAVDLVLDVGRWDADQVSTPDAPRDRGSVQRMSPQPRVDIGVRKGGHVVHRQEVSLAPAREREEVRGRVEDVQSKRASRDRERHLLEEEPHRARTERGSPDDEVLWQPRERGPVVPVDEDGVAVVVVQLGQVSDEPYQVPVDACGFGQQRREV